MQRLSALRRHHPSREGLQGGANGEVSWLRALGPRTFPVSQWRGARVTARYSGGAAPDSHRLPMIPVRDVLATVNVEATVRKL